MHQTSGEALPATQNHCSCGRSLSTSDAFCPGCGRQVSYQQVLNAQPTPSTRTIIEREPRETRKRSSLSRLLRGTVWTVGCLFCCVFALQFFAGFLPAFKKAYKSSYAASSRAPETASVEEAHAQLRLYQIGQDVHVGYWTYKIHAVRYGTQIADSMGRFDTAKGQYVMVDLTATNNDSTESSFPAMSLMGADGTLASETSAGSLLPNRLDFTTSLNPGLSARGFIVFDVRPQAYALQLSGGYSSGEKAYVSLPLAKDTTSSDSGSDKPSSDAATDSSNVNTQ